MMGTTRPALRTSASALAPEDAEPPCVPAERVFAEFLRKAIFILGRLARRKRVCAVVRLCPTERAQLQGTSRQVSRQCLATGLPELEAQITCAVDAAKPGLRSLLPTLAPLTRPPVLAPVAAARETCLNKGVVSQNLRVVSSASCERGRARAADLRATGLGEPLDLYQPG